MINIIKTAIITIIISFASGLMLDYFTNLAPKILCNVKNGIPLELNSKKVCAYIITVNNISNKTIHELALNIQSSQTNLKSTDATITKGLKFDSSIKDNILDVNIPFLSKGDEFSVTVYVENQYAVNDKPVIAIRSPENFKEIDSVEHKGILSLFFNIPKNINQVILQITKKSEKVPSNKKALITIVSIILIMIAGVLGKFYLNGTPNNNATTPIVNTTVSKHSTGVTGSSGQATGNTSTAKPKVGTARTTSTSGSAERTTGTNSKTESRSGTTGAETSGTAGTTGSKTETTGTKDSTGSAAGSAAGTAGTTGSKAGTTGATKSAAGTTSTTGSETGTTGN